MSRLVEYFLIVFNRLRERFQLFLLETRRATQITLTTFAIVSGVLGTVLLIVYFGFPLAPVHQELILNLVHVVFAIYVVNFLLRVLYTHHRVRFLVRHWFEGILIGLLILDFVSALFLGYPLLEWFFQHLGFENYLPIYLAFLQIYLLVLLFVEVGRLSEWLLSLRIHPAVLLMGSFLVLILLCTLLLLLPEMTYRGQMSFVDALFTATSATCVTGLTVVDTGSYFTLRGQVVILLFIQLGGLGIVSFATFFAFFMRGGLTFQHTMTLRRQLGLETMSDLFTLLKNIIVFTFAFEAVGACLLYLTWGATLAHLPVELRVFYSVFHAVSAFCNAGFSLFSESLADPRLQHNYQLIAITGTLFVIGGLGFPAIRDLFTPSEIRNRLRHPWRRLRTSSFIALSVSGGLLVVGGVFIWLLESARAFRDLPLGEQLVHAFFFSATARTAGFNTFPVDELSPASLLILIMLMFIGASSGSTGGGIKTSTFWVVVLSLQAILLQKPTPEIRQRSIPISLQSRAFAILFLALATVMMGTLVLVVLEGDRFPFLALLFEAVSAFGTVGLSVGITPELSGGGKLVLIALMYIGKLGPLTIALALAGERGRSVVGYPTTNIMLG